MSDEIVIKLNDSMWETVQMQEALIDLCIEFNERGLSEREMCSVLRHYIDLRQERQKDYVAYKDLVDSKGAGE